MLIYINNNYYFSYCFCISTYDNIVIICLLFHNSKIVKFVMFVIIVITVNCNNK